MNLINTILDKMSNISKPQYKFMVTLLTTMLLVHGKKTFRNLSRYSDLCEKTYSRQFRKPFDFVEFNRLTINATVPTETTLIAAMDCHFSEKSGKQTYGLDKFYNSKQSRPEKGLEISELAVVDVHYNTAYHLSIRQTPALDRTVKDRDATRIDWYLDHLKQDRGSLPSCIRYLATDGYYSKKKFIDAVLESGLHSIGKLRHDANLRYFYQGPQKPKGRRKRYDGKVRFQDLSRFELVQQKDGLSIYTAVVNSIRLKHDLRIVYLLKREASKILTALLFSTDTDLSPLEIYRFYKARFQIEFLFRDARQFCGLDDCQARCKESLHFHFNASMTALNVVKMEDRQLAKDSTRHVISISSWKVRKFNEHLLNRFTSMLGMDFSLIKSHPDYEQLINHGVVTA